MANNRNLDRVSGRIDKRGQGSDACTDGNAASGIQEPHKKIGSGGETKNNSSVAANNLFLSLAAQRKSSQSPPHGLAQAPPQDTVGDGRPDDISTSDIHTPRRQLGLLRYLFRVAFFIIMPPIYAVMCVFWHHYEMMVVFVFVLCFYGLLGQDRLRRQVDHVAAKSARLRTGVILGLGVVRFLRTTPTSTFRLLLFLSTNLPVWSGAFKRSPARTFSVLPDHRCIRSGDCW